MRGMGLLIAVIVGSVVGLLGFQAKDMLVIFGAVFLTIVLGFFLELAAYAVSEEYRVERRLEQITRR